MNGPVIFSDLTLGRISAKLGVHQIGYVTDYNGPNSVKAYWRCTLFDGAEQKPATSMKKAKQLMLHRAADWFEACGIPDALKIANDIRVQAMDVT